MKKTKIKFNLSLIFLLIMLIITIYFRSLAPVLESYLVPVLFVYFILDFLEILNPKWNKTVSSSKMDKRTYVVQTSYKKEILKKSIKTANLQALLIFTLYAIGVIIVGLLFNYTIWFDKYMLYLTFFAINLGDYICILYWCPFSSIFMNNKCCNQCRISNWDRFMKVSVLLFIPNFYTITLNIIALYIFIHWEYNHYRYPKRFYPISNKALTCGNCDKHNCGKPLYIKKKGL